MKLLFDEIPLLARRARGTDADADCCLPARALSTTLAAARNDVLVNRNSSLNSRHRSMRRAAPESAVAVRWSCDRGSNARLSAERLWHGSSAAYGVTRIIAPSWPIIISAMRRPWEALSLTANTSRRQVLVTRSLAVTRRCAWMPTPKTYGETSQPSWTTFLRRRRSERGCPTGSELTRPCSTAMLGNSRLLRR